MKWQWCRDCDGMSAREDTDTVYFDQDFSPDDAEVDPDDWTQALAQIASMEGQVIHFSRETYGTRATILFPATNHYIGKGTTFKALEAMDRVGDFYHSGSLININLRATGLRFNANGLATDAVRIRNINGYSECIGPIWGYSALQDGIVITDCVGATFTKLLANSNGQHGINCSGAGAALFLKPTVASNPECGLLVQPGTTSGSQVAVLGLVAELNGEHALRAQSVVVEALNTYAERNTAGALQAVSGGIINIRGGRIIQSGGRALDADDGTINEEKGLQVELYSGAIRGEDAPA